MMTETQRRIRAYKRALPALRERVIAVALLLAMSASMLTSASFAWLTISRRPEVTGVSTTVAANGNLEIALATSTTAPGESQVGDSSAAEGQSVTAANITWGNLVNLSDESYGLQSLVLRPAQLNEDALLTSPLYGAVFTADGRVEKLTSNFSYTSWVPPEGTKPGYFGVSNSLGVRAISSTKVEAVGFVGTYLSLKDAADSTNARAAGEYKKITQNSQWMTALANMMGIHMTATLNYEDQYINATVDAEDLKALIAMYGAFIDAFETEAQAIANMLNLQLYLAHGGNDSAYTPYDANAVLAVNKFDGKDYVVSVESKDKNGNPVVKEVKITNLKTFLADYKMLVSDKAVLEEIDAAGDRRWTASGLKTVINRLVNINQCLIKFKNEEAKTVAAFLNSLSGSGVFNALGYMNQECEATITNGVLYNFDQRVGAGIEVTASSGSKKGLPIKATVYVAQLGMEQSATVYATINISTTKPSEFTQDLNYADALNTGADDAAGVTTAEDTYGLALDLWVRTNAEASYLALEGNVLTEEEEVPVMGKDASGNDVQLYTVTREVETEEEPADGSSDTTETTEGSLNIGNYITYDLYKVEETTDNGDGTSTTSATWYRADTFTEFALEGNEEPAQKIETIYNVIGFEGENRIWNGQESMLSTDATTQGSGSCYVYYADSPEDQARSLELLKAMQVAFVDVDGSLLATASMDTAQSYEESGRVIVPLVVTSGGVDVGTGDDLVRAITPLVKNEPTRITAIVYLDGTMLSNENVLSAADIQGQLNIQFGSSMDLEPLRNEELESQERSVSAAVSVSEFDYDTHVGDMTTRVSITVSGEEPTNVTAFFMRRINSTQGSREPEMNNFVYNETTGAWECDYIFTSPGNYILRTVQLDGQEYVLKTQPTVSINGFSVKSLTCDQATGNKINIMTADASSTVNLALEFGSSDPNKMPKTVQGRFLRSDGTAVNVNFNLDVTNNIWKGSATFLASGDYTFQYLVLDGEYAELPEGLWKSATVYLGMRAAVYTNSPTSFKYLESEMTDSMKVLDMQVRIMDNSDNQMMGLQGAKLTYRLSTSAIETMETDLTWDAASGYYTGELLTLESGGPGTWIFSNVSVGGNTITNATTSPVFTMRSPEPPKYSGIPTKTASVFAPNGDAKMQANVDFSATSKVLAVITDASGREYEVQGALNGTSGNTSTWSFAVPTVSGTQDGYWTMKELRVWNYYDANGNYNGEITEGDTAEFEGDYLIFDVAKEAYTTKVVQTIRVAFATNDGNANKSFTGAFLATHSFSGVNVDAYDFEGQPLPNVTGMSLTYNYDGETSDLGGYTSTSVSAKDEYFTLSFTADETGKHFVQSNTQSVQYAGNYTPGKLTFTVNGQKTYTYTGTSGTTALPTGAPTVTVSSTKPTVKITAISNKDTSISVDNTTNASVSDSSTTTGSGCDEVTTYTVNNAHTTATPSIASNGLTATVYFKCFHSGETGYTEDEKYHYYYSSDKSAYGIPQVTITLSDINNFESATLNFSDSTHIYTDVQYTVSGFNGTWETTGGGATYSWTKEGTSVIRYIGYSWNQKSRMSDNINAAGQKTAAGTITANTLTVTSGGQSYTFTIPTITISNPY